MPENPNSKLYSLLNKADLFLEKNIDKTAEKLAKSYEKVLEQIQKEISSLYQKYGDEIKLSYAYDRLNNLWRNVSRELAKITGANKEALERQFRDIYTENYNLTTEAFNKSLNASLSFGQLDNKLVNAALYNPYDKIKWSERMKSHAQIYTQEIKNSVTTGLLTGQGYAKITKGITERTDILANKTIRIVRTEGHRIQSASRITGFDASIIAAENLGIKTERVWLATKDSRTRDDHREMDGSTANKDGLWRLPGGQLVEGPGLTGIAEQDINCRCTTFLRVNI